MSFLFAWDGNLLNQDSSHTLYWTAAEALRMQLQKMVIYWEIELKLLIPVMT